MNLVPLLVGLLIAVSLFAIERTLKAREYKSDLDYWEGQALKYRTRMTDAQQEADTWRNKYFDSDRIHEVDRLEHRKLEKAVREKLANPRVSWSKVAEQFSYLKVANDESGT
jgi:hypothetical protein